MINKKNYKTAYLYATLFIVGAVILVVEIAGTRVLAPFYGSTIFVWSSLISITLGFLSLGYFVGGFFADKHPKGELFYAIIFTGAASSLFLIKISQPILVFSDTLGLRTGPLVATLLLFALPFFLLSMAGPFAIRLRAKNLEHTGHTSGVIFAVSTAGSLAGALLTGFYLIPNFFIENIFISATVILMIVALLGFFIERGSRQVTGVAFLVVASLLFSGSHNLTLKEGVSIIHRTPSFYGEIAVAEREGVRCIVVNGISQTCIFQDGRQAFMYGHLITSLVDEETDFENALIIGLGGGTVARDLRPYFSAIDVVEIDPKMLSVAKEFFAFNDSLPELNTIIADGRKYLKTTEKTYDVVILDAFSGANPVPHLYTKESFEDIKNILSPGGIVVVNTLGWPYGEETALTHSVAKTINSVFPYIGIISSENIQENPEAFGNILFVASLEEKEFPIHERFVVLYEEEDIKGGMLLSDGRNSIETLGISVFEESQKGFQDIWGVL